MHAGSWAALKPCITRTFQTFPNCFRWFCAKVYVIVPWRRKASLRQSAEDFQQQTGGTMEAQNNVTQCRPSMTSQRIHRFCKAQGAKIVGEKRDSQCLGSEPSRLQSNISELTDLFRAFKGDKTWLVKICKNAHKMQFIIVVFSLN